MDSQENSRCMDRNRCRVSGEKRDMERMTFSMGFRCIEPLLE